MQGGHKCEFSNPPSRGPAEETEDSDSSESSQSESTDAEVGGCAELAEQLLVEDGEAARLQVAETILPDEDPGFPMPGSAIVKQKKFLSLIHI